MQADITPLIVGLLIFISSLISLKLGLSVAIIEIVLGVVAGNFGLKAEEWMMFLAGFGGIVLTFLAGAEIDTKLLKEKFKQSFLIGLFSFLTPFAGGFAYAYYAAGWSLPASLIAALAFVTAEFRFLLRKKRRQEKRCCPCPSRPYAGNNKELPKIWLLKIILFGSIKIQIITLYTIILSKLYLYDKWKNNKRKYQEITP